VARVSRVKRAVMGTWPYLRLRDLAIRAHRDNAQVIREDLARRYLSGGGIELGALTKPLRVPPGVHVRYADRQSRAELIRAEGPELSANGLDPQDIPEVDIVDDAATLATVPDAAADFVVANHVLEHLEDPIAGLETLLRVVRPGGIVFITLPVARRTFDARRERTSVEHLLRDHAEGPEWSREGHYAEWARIIECVPEERVADRVAEYARDDARHHFHVWELEDFLALLRVIDLPCELVETRAYAIEFAVVLRRR
jgi:predicted SAM-dependent methyltransferase